MTRFWDNFHQVRSKLDIYLFFFVLCPLYCQFLWIVFVCFSSSCVPYVASFSGLFLFVFLRLAYPVLSVSLDCPFLIAPLVFSNVSFQHRGHKTKKNKQKQSRETGNIGDTRRRKTNKNNPEKLAT
jgi:hypothetical protein